MAGGTHALYKETSGLRSGKLCTFCATILSWKRFHVRGCNLENSRHMVFASLPSQKVKSKPDDQRPLYENICWKNKNLGPCGARQVCLQNTRRKAAYRCPGPFGARRAGATLPEQTYLGPRSSPSCSNLAKKEKQSIATHNDDNHVSFFAQQHRLIRHHCQLLHCLIFSFIQNEDHFSTSSFFLIIVS